MIGLDIFHNSESRSVFEKDMHFDTRAAAIQAIVAELWGAGIKKSNRDNGLFCRSLVLKDRPGRHFVLMDVTTATKMINIDWLGRPSAPGLIRNDQPDEVFRGTTSTLAVPAIRHVTRGFDTQQPSSQRSRRTTCDWRSADSDPRLAVRRHGDNHR
jgi:hypothetical protein